MADKDDKFILMNMEDKRSKKVAEVMGNPTCKKILDYLTYNSEKSEEDIANALDMKLNTAEYNLKKLLESGLVKKEKKFFWSKKGKKIPTYSLAKKHIVISPTNTKPSLNALKTIFPAIMAVALIAILIVLALSGNTQTSGTEDIKGLEKFESMQDLQTFLQENQDSEEWSGGIRESTGVEPFQESDVTLGATASKSDESGAQDYSETNIQVEGVDEADIVKNDGKYIYIVSSEKIVIVNAYPAESMQVLSEINVSGAREIFINQDKLIVFSHEYKSRSKALVSIFDVSDRSNPILEKEVSVDGNYLNSRMIGNHVYLIANQYTGYNDINLPEIRVDGATKTVQPTEIGYLPYPDTSYTFTSILALNLQDGTYNLETYLLGASYTLFMSEKNIYLTAQKRISQQDIYNNLVKEVILPIVPESVEEQIQEICNSEDDFYIKQREITEIIEEYSNSLVGEEKSDFDSKLQETMQDFLEKQQKQSVKTMIHKIAVDGENIEYVKNSLVLGTVLNQFSMDEHNGYFRIATTTGNAWSSDNSLNHLWILNEDLEITGSVEDLAQGERIYSVRFMGEKAYVVTFRQIDPLFVLDLSDPSNPEVLGELKVTGFSNYLHPYDENHVIGIGKETTEEGRIQGVKIALFDVSDVNNPIEKAKYEVEGKWSNSNALYDHKAFLFDKSRNLLVLPISYTKEVYKDYVEGQILVGFNEDVTKKQAEELIENYGLSYYESVFTGPSAWESPLLKVMKVYVDNGEEQNWIDIFEDESLVKYAELNGIAEVASRPTYEHWQGAFVFNINTEDISLRGEIDHVKDTEERQYYYGPYAVQRSLYMDNTLYTISRAFVKANDLNTLDEINSVELDYEDEVYYGVGI